MNDNQEPQTKMISLSLTDMEGVGPARAKKLRDAGVVDVWQLAVKSATALSEILGCDKDDAAILVKKAHDVLRENNLLGGKVVTGFEELQRQKNIKKCTTGSKFLDYLLGGGIHTENTTEFYGEAAAGKTQICHTTAIMATQPEEDGGLDGAVIWVDTEGTCHPDRLEQIAKARGLDAEQILKERIFIMRSYNSSHFELIIKELPKYVQEHNAKLVIVDSIINQHRGEFGGMGTLADRQQRLNDIMHTLERLASIYKVAIIYTNQVMDAPATFAGDPTKPVGGNIIGHASGTRIYLRKAGKVGNKAILKDSAKLPPGEAIYRITEKGIEDNEEEYTKFAAELERRKQKEEEADEDDGKAAVGVTASTEAE